VYLSSHVKYNDLNIIWYNRGNESWKYLYRPREMEAVSAPNQRVGVTKPSGRYLTDQKILCATVDKCEYAAENHKPAAIKNRREC